jgi:hypothetical protein
MPGMDLELLSGGDMGDVGYYDPRYARGPYARPGWGRPFAAPGYAAPGYAAPGYGYPGYGYPYYHHHHHHRPWAQVMGYNPQLAMMGDMGHGGGAPHWFNYLAGEDGPPPDAPPPPPHHHHHGGMGSEHVPLAMVQPAVPGVSQRGGRVQPLGFTPGRFDATSGTELQVIATPQRPLRGGRLVGTYSRIGVTATGLLFLASLTVGTDGQLLSGDAIGFDMLSPNSFGVGVNFTPASVGNQIIADVSISDAPGSDDSIPFSLGLWGLTVG